MLQSKRRTTEIDVEAIELNVKKIALLTGNKWNHISKLTPVPCYPPKHLKSCTHFSAKHEI